MGHGIYVLLFALGLFLGMLMLLEVGRRIGVRRLAQDPEGAEAGVGHRGGRCVCLARSAYCLYVILHVEYPRLGFIRVDAFDRALAELRESMK